MNEIATSHTLFPRPRDHGGILDHKNIVSSGHGRAGAHEKLQCLWQNTQNCASINSTKFYVERRNEHGAPFLVKEICVEDYPVAERESIFFQVAAPGGLTSLEWRPYIQECMGSVKYMWYIFFSLFKTLSRVCREMGSGPRKKQVRGG